MGNLILKRSVTVAVLVFNFEIAIGIWKNPIFMKEKLGNCSMKC